MHDRERRRVSAVELRFPHIGEEVLAQVRDPSDYIYSDDVYDDVYNDVCDDDVTVDLLEYRGVDGYVPLRELREYEKLKGNERNMSTHYMLEVVSISRQDGSVELTKKI